MTRELVFFKKVIRVKELEAGCESAGNSDPSSASKLTHLIVCDLLVKSNVNGRFGQLLGVNVVSRLTGCFGCRLMVLD